jgi:hypothetical protein
MIELIYLFSGSHVPPSVGNSLMIVFFFCLLSAALCFRTAGFRLPALSHFKRWRLSATNRKRRFFSDRNPIKGNENEMKYSIFIEES